MWWNLSTSEWWISQTHLFLNDYFVMIHWPQMAILVPVKEIVSVFQKRPFVLLWLPPNANGTHWTISNNNFSLKVKLAELLGRSKVTAAALEGICENRRVKKNFEYSDVELTWARRPSKWWRLSNEEDWSRKKGKRDKAICKVGFFNLLQVCASWVECVCACAWVC